MYEEKIAKGMTLLDEKMPGWEDRIDLDSLRLSSKSHCVLGQIYGSGVGAEEGFFVGRRALGLAPQVWDLCTSNIAADYGFDMPYAPVPRRVLSWVTLTQEWKNAILQRRQLNADLAKVMERAKDEVGRACRQDELALA